MPAAPVCCFAVSLDDRLVGAVVFISGPRNGSRVLGAARPRDVVTLARQACGTLSKKNMVCWMNVC